jgi:PAS domain S-box-containing protein
VIAAVCIALAGAANAQPKEILVLVQSAGDRGATAMNNALEAELRRWPGGVEIFVEQLDPARFPEAGQEATTARFFREKYANRRIDLTIGLGPAAVGFLGRYGNELFPGAPLVFGGVRQSGALGEELPPAAQGVVSSFDLVGTLDLALALQPTAQHIAVVTGVTAVDVSWNALARERLSAYADRLEVTYLEGLPPAELLEKVAALPRDSIVLFLTMFEDREGAHLVPVADLVRRIAAASSAPVYGVYDILLGEGIVGGYVEPKETIGADMGRLALEILAEQSTDNAPIRVAATPAFIVDARQLRRWALEESRLPADTIVRFRDPSLWSQYSALIFGAAAFMVFQTMLIIVLVLRSRERRAEHALQETEDRYRNVVEAQTAYCRYFGRTRDELVGKKFVEFIPEAERDSAFQHLQSLIANPRTESNTHRVLKPDGSVGWQQWIDHVIVDATHRGQVEIQGIGRDVTQLKMAEIETHQQREQLTHLTRVAILGELSGALAHELNQPLTAILSNAQAAERLLAGGLTDVVEFREILKDIVADDIRAGEVISRLRALLKRGVRKLEPLRIDDVVGEALALAHSQLLERHVTLIVDHDRHLPTVLGDRVQMQQVLLNVIMNASEALNANEPTDRALSVSTARADGGVRVVVTDNGPGFSPEVVDRLFEPFVTTKPNGLGLGLSICRSIIGAHGGRLVARNSAYRGAIFEITLPLTGS